ncbi:MAG: hypothetical protein RMA76_13320 [Deltaproteobacteria bacterium]
MERLFESARRSEPVTPEALARIERRGPPEARGAQRRWVFAVAMVIAGGVVLVQSRTSVRTPKPVAVRTVPAHSPTLGPAVDGAVEIARAAGPEEPSSRGAEIEGAGRSRRAREAVPPRASGSRRGAESSRPGHVLDASAASPSEGAAFEVPTAASGAAGDEGSGAASGAVASGGVESVSGAVVVGGSESASGAVAVGGAEFASGALASGGSELASAAVASGSSESASRAVVSGGSESASGALASGGSESVSRAVAVGGSESASGALAFGGSESASGALASGGSESAVSPPAAVAPSFRDSRRSRPKGLRRTLPAYRPRAVRELVELGTQRLAERELTAEVRRILALTDRRSMLAQLDRIAIDDPDVIALRGALRVEAERCRDALADLSRVERLAPRSPAASYASRVRRWCVAAR